MNKPAPALALSEGRRQTLQRLSRSTSAAHRLVVRSRALLLAGDGVANARIAAECGVAVSTVVGWRKRFAADGLREFGRVAKGLSYTHLRAHETPEHLVCRLLL